MSTHGTILLPNILLSNCESDTLPVVLLHASLDNVSQWSRCCGTISPWSMTLWPHDEVKAATDSTLPLRFDGDIHSIIGTLVCHGHSFGS